jgi:hypothetical protein
VKDCEGECFWALSLLRRRVVSKARGWRAKDARESAFGHSPTSPSRRVESEGVEGERCEGECFWGTLPASPSCRVESEGWRAEDARESAFGYSPCFAVALCRNRGCSWGTLLLFVKMKKGRKKRKGAYLARSRSTVQVCGVVCRCGRTREGRVVVDGVTESPVKVWESTARIEKGRSVGWIR